MPRYKVHLYKTYNMFATVDVDAEDEFQAEEIALDRSDNEDLDWGGMQLDDGGVDYIEENEE